MRERQLLDAAERLLLEHGHRALTFTTLSHATGLARNSIYEYFPSKDELIAAVCERELSRWTGPVHEAVSAETDPRRQLRAYIDAQLDLAEQGRHRLAPALAGAPLGPDARQRIRGVHNTWLHLATDALSALGHPHPAIAASYIQALVEAATRGLDAGGEPTATRTTLHQLLDKGLATPLPGTAERNPPSQNQS